VLRVGYIPLFYFVIVILRHTFLIRIVLPITLLECKNDDCRYLVKITIYCSIPPNPPSYDIHTTITITNNLHPTNLTNAPSERKKKVNSTSKSKSFKIVTKVTDVKVE
jgi:hypothetical protein